MMRLQFLLICIVVAVLLGLIFGWQVRGRIAKRDEEARESESPIRDAVFKRFRTGIRSMVFGGGRKKKPAAKKPASKPPGTGTGSGSGGDDESTD